jgi:hypothetical protein
MMPVGVMELHVHGVPAAWEAHCANALLGLLLVELEAGRGPALVWALVRDAPGGRDWVAWAWRHASDDDLLCKVLEALGRAACNVLCERCLRFEPGRVWWNICARCADLIRDAVPALTLADVLAETKR